jgi:hypothetical protein
MIESWKYDSRKGGTRNAYVTNLIFSNSSAVSFEVFTAVMFQVEVFPGCDAV